VKMYSSGMQLRLGFAIASHLDPDIFVVDEALAVGDAGFQAKCVDRMRALVSEGRTLVFVSHDLHAVESICDRGLFLREGHAVAEGPAREVLKRYLSWVEERRADSRPAGPARGLLEVTSAACYSLDGEELRQIEPGEGLEIRIRFHSEAPLRRPHVNLGITDGRPGLLLQCSMLNDGLAPERVDTNWECRCRIESLPLLPRLYEVYCDVFSEHGYGIIMDWTFLTAFRIVGEHGRGPQAAHNAAVSGALAVPYSWKVASAEPVAE
jgi:lipopolysaccharide transport system ATP-binding protein